MITNIVMRWIAACLLVSSCIRETPAQHKEPEQQRELQPGVGREFIPPPPIPPVPEGFKALERGGDITQAPPITLEELEQFACGNNPTLTQAQAQVQGELGLAIQAGLWPNPRLFYIQEQIGVKDTPGEFVGGAVEQEIVTAHKLDLSRAKFLYRTRTVEWLALAQQYRVLNDVRVHYFRTLGRQEIVDIHRQLLKNGEDSLVTFREMYNVGQANRAEVHGANVALQQVRLDLLMMENDLQQAWEELVAIVGVELPPRRVAGPLGPDVRMLEWGPSLGRILAESPELQAARSKLCADEVKIKREIVEPVPNINIRAGAGHNYEAEETVGMLEVFAEIPLFDWNQGTIRQAEADFVRQKGEIRRIELSLRQRLAPVYRNYLTALQMVRNYEEVILPESRRAYELQLDSYAADRIRWTDVLLAEREYLQRRVTYVQNLVTLRESEVLIVGYLLHGGLVAPQPLPPGHIDVTVDPR